MSKIVGIKKCRLVFTLFDMKWKCVKHFNHKIQRNTMNGYSNSLEWKMFSTMKTRIESSSVTNALHLTIHYVCWSEWNVSEFFSPKSIWIRGYFRFVDSSVIFLENMNDIRSTEIKIETLVHRYMLWTFNRCYQILNIISTKTTLILIHRR